MRRSWCDSTENGICVITTNRTVSRPFQLRHKGDVEFRGAQWQCVISKGSYESLHIDIAVDGKLSLRKGSLLHCATIVLEAVKIELSDSSEVSANGTAFGSEPAIEKDPLGWSGVRRGASHGGLGGSGPGCASDDTLLLRRLSLAYGSLLAPWSMGRAGVAAARGLGGGRVRVAAQELTLNGTVSAAGVGPENIGDDEERDDTAAGSGGSIWITCRSLVQLTSQGNATSNTTPPILLRSGSGRIVATGGSCAGCLCGGGGRVVTEFAHGTAPRHVLVSGGCWRSTTALAHESTVYHHAAPLSECACGSAGTWVLRKQSGSRRSRSPGLPSARGLPRGLQHRKILKSQGQSEGDTVFVDNSHAVSLAGSKLSQPTPLAMNFGRPVALQLHDAVVVPSEERPQWNLTSLRLVSETIGSILRHLAPSPLVLKFAKPNEGVELALSSILQANELQITGAQEVVLQQNAAIDAAVASISAREVIDTHRGALGQGGGVFGLHARRVVLGGGRLRRAWISAREALTVKRGSRLLTSHRRCDQLRAPPQDPCERQLKSRSWTPGEAAPLLGNQSGLQNVTFDIVLVATNGSITVEGDAEVHAAALLLCATANLTVGGLVSARGLGCPPNRGESAGAAPEVSEHGRRDPLCGGGGGAHCGHGGDGVQSGAPHAPCPGTGGQKYDGWWGSEAAGSARPTLLPTWSASGGGGPSGGAGGGVIWVRAHVLHLASNSTCLSASGDAGVLLQDGGSEGAGGGAGGSILLNASSIVGSGRVEADGGHGGGCTGGGGGGGAIGGMCLDAPAAWRGFRGALTVEGGAGDSSPACGRRAGPQEQRGGAGELLQLAGCRPGQEGIFCAECAPGFFNPEKEPNGTEAVYRVCVPCTNKPAHANYTAKGWLNESCPYVCPGGYPPVEVNPNCDDPWTYYFAFFGGIRGASVFTISMISFFGLSVSASRVRRRKRLQWLRKHQQGSHQFHGLADEMLLLFESVRGPHPLADMHRWSQERSHYRPERSLTGRFGFIERWVRPLLPTLMRRTHSQTHLLSVGDLPYHIGRIYLLGENSPKDPWRLCRQPPDALKHLIDPARWEAFAAHVTERCQHKIRSQKVVEGVLSWLYLPLAEYVRHRLRLARAANVALYVWSRSENTCPGETFWRLTSGSNASRLGMKFGTDRQITLAFVDVLDYGRSLQDWVVKPPLPMVIAAAGDGKYTAPYQLDYLDPFVQSVSQYVGRRVWHQVLLAFNLLARLLPPNPSEEDVRLLRRSMAQISTEVMHQTDLECHAVLFRAPAHKRSHVPRKPRSVSRQSSWEAMVAGSSRGSPKGGQTPVRSDVPLVGYRHRPALVLSQRAPSDTLRHQGRPGRVGADSQARKRPRVRRVVHVGSSGLFSPTDELLLDAADDSPVLSFSFAPIGPGESPLNEAGFSDGLQPLSLFRSDSIQNLELNQDSNRWHITVGAAEHSSRPMPDFSEASGISSPMHDDEPPSPEKPQQARWNPNRGSQRLSTASASSSLAALEAPLLGHARGDRRRRRLPAFLAWGFCEDLWGSAEAWFRLLCTPCQAAYRGYLRTLRGISALGGVGRQSGLFLRHRKPRGSQVTTLLCLLLWLLVATMLFIAQSTVLFRLGRHHYSFFAALLSPPFAEIMALVHGVMFVCGATDGSTVCMFVVASISSMAVALICRINAVFYVNMDAIYVEGLLHVMAEYGIAFASKVFICRLVNMMIAYAEAEPVLDPSAGHEADHAWVREHVLFRARSGRAASPLRQRVGSDMSSGWTSTEEAADWTATMRMRRQLPPILVGSGQEDDDSPSQHESRQVSPSQFESHPEFFPQTSGGSLSDSPRAHQD